MRSSTYSGQSIIVALLLAGTAACSGVDTQGSKEASAGAEETAEAADALVEPPLPAFLENPASGASMPGLIDVPCVMDTFIDGASQNANHAYDTTMSVLNYAPTQSIEKRSYIRFVVDRLNTSATVTGAQVRLNVTSGSIADVSDVRLRLASDAWSEYKFTWSTGFSIDPLNGPTVAAATVLDAAPDTSMFPLVTFDVSSVVKGNGVYSFRIAGVAMGKPANEVQFATSNAVGGCNGGPCVDLRFSASQNPDPSNCMSITSTDGSTKLKANQGLNEVSGLAASAKFPGSFYTHNDNGTTPGQFFKIDSTGTLKATFKLPTGFNTSDTEEIQVGPGPTAQTSYVYFGDIGDNAHSRTGTNNPIKIFRISEEKLTATSGTVQLVSGDVQTLRLKYPSGSPNSEAFIIDPVTSDLTVIEKPDNTSAIKGLNRIFYMLAPLKFSSTSNPTALALTDTGNGIQMGADPEGGAGDQDLPGANSVGVRSTGAAVSRTGTKVLVTFYGQTLYFRRDIGPSVYDANIAWLLTYYGFGAECLGINIVTANAFDDPRREAISFGRDPAKHTGEIFTTGELYTNVMGNGTNGLASNETDGAHEIWKYTF
jgi:hypothetical protein